MTKTIKSETSNKHYFLTIDESNHATDCTCPDHQYRRHDCKHMRLLDEQVTKAIAFAALRQQYDYRSETQRELRRAAYLRYEMSIGVL